MRGEQDASIAHLCVRRPTKDKGNLGRHVLVKSGEAAAVGLFPTECVYLPKYMT